MYHYIILFSTIIHLDIRSYIVGHKQHGTMSEEKINSWLSSPTPVNTSSNGTQVHFRGKES